MVPILLRKCFLINGNRISNNILNICLGKKRGGVLFVHGTKNAHKNESFVVLSFAVSSPIIIVECFINLESPFLQVSYEFSHVTTLKLL